MRPFISSAICSVKLFFREPIVIIMMFILPVVMMFILGTALNEAFTNGFKLKDFNVAYIDNSKDINISKGFSQIITELSKNDVKFTKITDEKAGIGQVSEKKFACLVILNADGGINLYKNGVHHLGGDILEEALKSFQNRVSAVKYMYMTNPQRAEELFKDETSTQYIESMGVNGKKAPTANEYYGIACINMVLFFGIVTIYMRVVKDMISGTAKRKFATPANPYAVYIGGLTGNFIASLLQIAIICGYCIFVNGLNWGSHIPVIYSLFAAEAFMIVGAGGLIGCLVKKKNQINMVSFIMLGVAWFINLFAGNFASLENYNFSDSMVKILRLSPILKVNDAIFGLLYNGDNSLAAPCIFTCVIIGAVCIFISVLFYKRRVHA